MSREEQDLSRPIGKHFIWMILLGGLFQLGWIQSAHAQTTTYYGPPYTEDSGLYTSGIESGSVDGAVQAFENGFNRACQTALTCKPYHFDVKQVDPSKNTDDEGLPVAAHIYIVFDGIANPETYSDGDVRVTSSYSDVTKNVGSPKLCPCASGNGGHTGGAGSQGSSGDSATDKQPIGAGSTFEGDPINIASGNKFEQDTDYRSPTPWLVFRRFYNSIPYGVLQSTLGPQWRHSFDRSLEFIQYSGNTHANTANLFRPDGTRPQFTWTGSTWAAQADNADTLNEQDNTSGSPIGYSAFVAETRQTEQYSVAGLLQSITDANGKVTTLAYSTASTPSSVAPTPNLLLTVTDPQGRTLSFTYNSNGTISSVTLPDGGKLSYSYNSTSGVLTSAQYPDGKTRQYVYNESSLMQLGTSPVALTGLVDELGNRFESTNYFEGAASGTQSASGAGAMSYSFGTLTTPLGLKLSLGFQNALGAYKPASSSQSCGTQCNETNESATYDANGYPATTTDWNGNVTKTTYDANGLLDVQIDASGASTQRTTTTTWNTALRVPLTRRVTDTYGNTFDTEAWAYNAAGQVTAHCLIDPAVSGASGYSCGSAAQAPAGVRQWSSTYCTAVNGTQCPLFGLKLTDTGPRTDLIQTTTYSYYLTASATSCGTPGAACYQPGDLKSVTDALGHVTTIASYDADGRPTRLTDANGINTDLTYTPRGWLATRSINGALTTYGYTAYGALASVTDPDGVQTTYTYDAAHRLTRLTDALGNYLQYTLDAAGNRIKEQTYTANGTLTTTLNRTYNTLGQLTQVTDGLGHAVFNASANGAYDGNGNLLLSADANGIQQQRSYDGLNRQLSQVDNYQGTDSTANTAIWSYLDAADRLTGVMDPSQLKTATTYDGLSNPTAQSSPDTGTSYSDYDAAGNRVEHYDAKGIEVFYSYDALNRLTTVSYPDSSQNISYHYDEANSVTGCPTTSAPIGRLTRIVEANVTTVFCRGPHGNLIERDQITASGTDYTEMSYTPGDRLSSRIYPDGANASYSRNANGQISAISLSPPHQGSSPAVSNISYLPFGPISSYTLGNGQTITRSYDANNRLTDLTSPALNLHYARDAMGNITAQGDAPGAANPTETYSYDPLYRLTQVSAGGTAQESVTYNATGDRTSKSGGDLATGTYSYNTGTHQLTATGNYARAADANGNTTAIIQPASTYGLGYSDRNRLTVAQLNGSTIGSYTYNALGERIQKTAGATATRFIYDDDQQLLTAEATGSGTRDYVWLDELPVAVVDSVNGGVQGLGYITADALGTPRAVATSWGATVWQWSTTGNAWGEASPTSNGYVLNLRYPGQYYDAESGTNYNMFRTYEPATGRYLQSDPVGLLGGISTFGYVDGNPLSYIDPYGLATVILVGGPAGLNVAGHVAIGFTGQGVYSYGTSDAFGSSVTGYLASQATYRSTTAYILNTTPEQEQTMMNYITSNYSQPGQYSVLRNHDCASMVNGAMSQAGIGDDVITSVAQAGGALFPQLPTTSALMASTFPGAQTVQIPQGGAIPAIMNSFNPAQ